FRNRGAVGGQQIASARAIEDMMTPHQDQPIAGQYGYGLAVEQNFFGPTLVGHGGGNKGISAFFALIPEEGMTVAALANLASVPTRNVALGAVNALLGRAPDAQPIQQPKRA